MPIGAGRTRWRGGWRRKGDRATAIVNAGISGNRLLSNSPCYGEAVVSRFERDALRQPGRARDHRADRHQRHQFRGDARARRPRLRHPHTEVTADALIARLPAADRAGAPARRQDVRRDVDAGVAAAGAGEHPARGQRIDPHRAARSTASIDFDRALRDPAHPERAAAPHSTAATTSIPSDAGYAAMAAAVPIDVVAARRQRAVSVAKKICVIPLSLASASPNIRPPRLQDEGRERKQAASEVSKF